MSDYASLLVGDPSLANSLYYQPPDLSASLTASANAAATGRFSMRRKTLTYSFVCSPGFGQPKLVTFMDAEKNIVEEFQIQTTPFQVSLW